MAVVKLWDNPENVSLNWMHTITSVYVSVTDSLDDQKECSAAYIYPALWITYSFVRTGSVILIAL